MYCIAEKYGRSNWGKYTRFKNRYLVFEELYYNGKWLCDKDFAPIYGSTVHKSQGSTYTHTAIALKDILSNYKDQERRRLLYVALSRSTDTNIILM